MAAGKRLIELVAVMDRLRSPGGCPWDAKQTHESLLTYLLEETHELVDAVESHDRASLKEELGDVLLQVVFHARIASEDENEPFDIDAVADGIIEKLITRHPHVFGDAETLKTPDQVEASWEQLKAVEKGRTSAVDGVPMGQPALSLATKLIQRASRQGVSVAINEQISVDGEITSTSIGELLLRVVALAEKNEIDAEAALRGAARKYAEEIVSAEESARDSQVE
ncbi:MAG TPA: MazG family protein [Candidatus Nanopelagicaceae bacterium]|nr:MazG family protein [Candidatus Nanopelagicaceae bacterium]